MAETRLTRASLVLALCATLALAGCLGGSSSEEAVNTTDAGPVSDAPEATSTTDDTAASGNLTFETDPIQRTVTENGTFAAQDTAFAGGSIRGTDTQSYDLGPEVPVGVPVELNVTIEYGGQASQLNGDLVLEGVEVYEDHYYKDFQTNTIYMEAQIAKASRGGTVTAVVQADLTGASPERSYTLTATIQGFGDHVIPGTPVSVPVTETSEGFELEAGDGSSLPSTAVWGPDGFVGRLQGQAGSLALAAEEAQGPGRYVVLVGTPAEPGAQPSRIQVSPLNATGEPGSLEVVPAQRSMGDWHRVDPESSATWSFNRSSPPIRAGIVVRPVTPTGVAADPTGYLSVSLSTPAGTVVESTTQGAFVGGVPLEWLGPVGDPALVPGSYSAEVSLSAGTPFEAAHVTYDLDR